MTDFRFLNVFFLCFSVNLTVNACSKSLVNVNSSQASAAMFVTVIIVIQNVKKKMIQNMKTTIFKRIVSRNIMKK